MDGANSVRAQTTNGPMSCVPKTVWSVGDDGDSTVIREQDIKVIVAGKW